MATPSNGQEKEAPELRGPGAKPSNDSQEETWEDRAVRDALVRALMALAHEFERQGWERAAK